MPTKDDGILVEILLEDVIMGIDELAVCSAVMRLYDPKLAGKILVAGKALQAQLAEMSFLISRTTVEKHQERSKSIGQTVMRWSSRKTGAGMILTDEGKLFRREGLNKEWLFHSLLEEGKDALAIVKSTPGGPWRLVQGEKWMGEHYESEKPGTVAGQGRGRHGDHPA